jgi:hypothetical protein
VKNAGDITSLNKESLLMILRPVLVEEPSNTSVFGALENFVFGV